MRKFTLELTLHLWIWLTKAKEQNKQENKTVSNDNLPSEQIILKNSTKLQDQKPQGN